MSQPVKCEICGKEVKNLGSHMYHSHGESQQSEFITDKELAISISQIQDILKQYRNSTDMTIKSEYGRQKEIQLLITIQMK